MAGAIMETQHIRYFLSICDELSFTRAAQKCGIKQPTLSEAIKQIEQAMGGKLFVRAPPVRLTKFGFQLQPICRQINETHSGRQRTRACQASCVREGDRADAEASRSE